MVNTAHRSDVQSSAPTYVPIGLALALLCSSALAQSTGAFATLPYTPTAASAASTTHEQDVPQNARPALVSVSSRYRGPPPVVMFRGTPPLPPLLSSGPLVELARTPAQPQAAPPTRQYSIVTQAQRDADNSSWDPANLGPVAAPPIVPGMSAQPLSAAGQRVNLTDNQRYRGPMRRILEDTGRGIVRGIPEAVAGALPWVDREANSEPFKAVLERAADDLTRAARGDPAWALPAQNELRALSRRLDSLSAPPFFVPSDDNLRPKSGVAGVDERPFRPRPIWPGAEGRPEAQVRPVTLITTTGQQNGPSVTGVTGRYIPAIEDDDGAPPAQAAPIRSRNGARGTPSPRRVSPTRLAPVLPEPAIPSESR